MNATTKVSYDPSNFPQLAPIAEKATELLNRAKGGAAELKKKLVRIAPTGDLTPDMQIRKPDGGAALRSFTLGELADSAINEVTGQAVDPDAVGDVLFGRYGLIRQTGGGRTDRLMEDVEVAYIKDFVNNTTVGPIITSGRHRTLAMQILLKSAGIQGYRDFKIRCSVIQAGSQEEVQARIISANTGSRDFARAEIREREGATSGIVMTNCQTIEDTIIQANKNDDLKAAFSAYLKLLAGELQLNHFTPAQYSDAGSSLWGQLDAIRPNGCTFAKWMKENKEGRFMQIMTAAKDALPTAVTQAQHDPNKGTKASKIARALAPLIAAKCF